MCDGCDRCGGIVGAGPFLEARGQDYLWCQCRPLGVFMDDPQEDNTDGNEGPSGSGAAETRPELEQGQVKRERGDAPAEGSTESGRGHPEAKGATGVRGAAPMRTRHPVLHLHGSDGPSGSWAPRRVAPRF